MSVLRAENIFALLILLDRRGKIVATRPYIEKSARNFPLWCTLDRSTTITNFVKFETETVALLPVCFRVMAQLGEAR